MTIRGMRRLLGLANFGLLLCLVGAVGWVVTRRPGPVPGVPDARGEQDPSGPTPLNHYSGPILGVWWQPKMPIVDKAPLPDPVDRDLVWLKDRVAVSAFAGGAIDWTLRGQSQASMWFPPEEKSVEGRKVKLLAVNTADGQESATFGISGKRFTLSKSGGWEGLGGGGVARGPARGAGPTEQPRRDEPGEDDPSKEKGPEKPPEDNPQKDEGAQARLKDTAREEGSGGRTVRLGAGDWRIARSEQRDVFDNFDKHLQQLNLVLHTENNQVVGLRIASELDPQSLAYKRGFRQGDIVKQVDKFNITSVSQLQQLKKQLSNAPQLRVHFVRNGEEQRVTFRLSP